MEGCDQWRAGVLSRGAETGGAWPSSCAKSETRNSASSERNGSRLSAGTRFSQSRNGARCCALSVSFAALSEARELFASMGYRAALIERESPLRRSSAS